MPTRSKDLARLLVSYRSSTASSDTEFDEIAPPPCPPGCKPTRKRRRDSARTFTSAQLDAALELMQINGLSELERADFSAFEGKKLSWAHLAKGCVARISSQLLQLSSLREASENADLLHHRLESRRAQSVRTTNETANSILAVYHAARSLNELNQMANGTLPHDIDGSISRCTVVRRRFLALTPYAPDIRPRTVDLERLVKSALETVLKSSLSEGTKAMARRALNQWTVCEDSQRGERVCWDSD